MYLKKKYIYILCNKTKQKLSIIPIATDIVLDYFITKKNNKVTQLSSKHKLPSFNSPSSHNFTLSCSCASGVTPLLLVFLRPYNEGWWSNCTEISFLGSMDLDEPQWRTVVTTENKNVLKGGGGTA